MTSTLHLLYQTLRAFVLRLFGLINYLIKALVGEYIRTRIYIMTSYNHFEFD